MIYSRWSGEEGKRRMPNICQWNSFSGRNICVDDASIIRWRRIHSNVFFLCIVQKSQAAHTPLHVTYPRHRRRKFRPVAPRHAWQPGGQGLFLFLMACGSSGEENGRWVVSSLSEKKISGKGSEAGSGVKKSISGNLALHSI